MRIDSNTRITGGVTFTRRFAYLKKSDHTRFGLLLATDSQNARQHLGRGFYIRQIWLTLDEEHEAKFNSDRKWEIVSSVFLNPSSVAFIGHKQ